VIIDEAHNVIDAISSMYSETVHFTQLSMAMSQLTQYHDRYQSRLKVKNIRYIKILYLISVFMEVLSKPSNKPESAADLEDSVQ